MKAFQLIRRTAPISASALAFAVALASPAAADGEIEDRGPYYEDDAWYDISEWFDGNDYNPTDEVIGRIDDEVYNAAEDTGGDDDNDRWFGFDTRLGDDNWFYDYYDDGDLTSFDWDNDGTYEYAYRFIDFDGDDLYDGWYHWHDWNRDGQFDQVTYYSLNEVAAAQSGAATSQGNQSSWTSGQKRVKGTVRKLKKVSVRDTKHLCAQLELENGSKCMVDLGPTDGADQFEIDTNDQISVHGPMTMVGGKKLIVADRVSANGTNAAIDRNRRSVEGRVTAIRTQKLRDRDHLILVVKTKSGKTCAVDAGPLGDKASSITRGDTVTAEGAMVKANDRRLLMAKSVECDGTTFNIDRRMPNTQTSRK